MEMKVLGLDIFPLITWTYGVIPDSWRKSLISKKNAPVSDQPLRDIFDLTGEFPYEKEEVVPGKVWMVTYMCEESGITSEEKKKQSKALGWNPASEKFQEKGRV